jgi:hypothetical protein
MEGVATLVVILVFIFICGIYVDTFNSRSESSNQPKYRDHSISYRTVKKKK